VTMFWLAAGVITLGVLVFVVVPLFRAANTSSDDTQRTDYDVALYKDQLHEIDRDLERGILTLEQADAARVEIQRKLLIAAEQKPSEFSTSKTLFNNKLSACLVALFITAGTFSLYMQLGIPQFPNLPYAERDIESERRAVEDNKLTNEMAVMLGKLAKRLEKDPDDVEGWQLLARSLISVRQYDDAVHAYKRAYALLPNDPNVAVDYAESLIFSNQGQVNEEARGLLDTSLKAVPSDPKIRYYIGLSKAQAEDYKGALQDWTDIAAMSPPDAPWMMTVRQQMEQAFTDAGLSPKDIKPSPEALEIAKSIKARMPAASAPGQNAPGPSAEDVEAASKMSAGDQSKMIRGMVDRLAQKLKDNPDDLEGWTRLARAYQVLGETEKAQDAMKRIEELKNR